MNDAQQISDEDQRIKDDLDKLEHNAKRLETRVKNLRKHFTPDTWPDFVKSYSLIASQFAALNGQIEQYYDPMCLAAENSDIQPQDYAVYPQTLQLQLPEGVMSQQYFENLLRTMPYNDMITSDIDDVKKYNEEFGSEQLDVDNFIELLDEGYNKNLLDNILASFDKKLEEKSATTGELVNSTKINAGVVQFPKVTFNSNQKAAQDVSNNTTNIASVNTSNNTSTASFISRGRVSVTADNIDGLLDGGPVSGSDVQIISSRRNIQHTGQTMVNNGVRSVGTNIIASVPPRMPQGSQYNISSNTGQNMTFNANNRRF